MLVSVMMLDVVFAWGKKKTNAPKQAAMAPSSAPTKTGVNFADLVSKSPELQSIVKKGVITVATGTYVPFEYRDSKTNEIVGFDIELAKYISEKLGVKLSVTDMTFQAIIPSIQNGSYDFSIAAMYKTPARCEVVLMSKSYCDTGMILAVKSNGKHTNIKSLEDCNGLKVAVKTGATSQKVAEDFMREHPKVKYQIVGFEDTVGCVSDVLAERCDVVVNDLLNQQELNKTYSGISIVCEPFTHAENAIAVRKGRQDLLAFIDACIDEYYADGTYQTLWAKWIEGK